MDDYIKNEYLPWLEAQDFGEGIDTLQKKGVYDAFLDMWGDEEEYREEIEYLAEHAPYVLRVKYCDNMAEEWSRVTGRDSEEYDEYKESEVNSFVLNYDGYVYYFD